MDIDKRLKEANEQLGKFREQKAALIIAMSQLQGQIALMQELRESGGKKADKKRS